MPSSWLIRWDTTAEATPQAILAGSEQPDIRSAFYSGPQGFVAFAGDLFDRSSYHAGPEASPAECVAEAYASRGERLFDRLRGSFALAIWDLQRKRLVTGRDAMGLHPFYYFWNGRLLILSPNIDQILAQPEITGAFNRVMLAEYLFDVHHGYQCCETYFEEINRLPAAHRLCLAEGRLDIDRYWDPLPEGFQWLTEEELGNLQPTLERAVSRCLEAGGDSLALSGGFDSVSIAILAAAQRNGKSPLHALSLRFDNDDESEDEGETQTAVARTLGMPQVMLSVRDLLDEKNVVAASLGLSQVSPSPVLSLWQSIYYNLLAVASTHGLHKILMGTGGDELFTVDPGYGADRLAVLDLAGIWRYYRAMARSSQTPSRYIARNIFWTYGAKLLLMRKLREGLEAASHQFARKVRKQRIAFQSWLMPCDPVLKEAVIDRLLYQPQLELAPGEGEYVHAIRSLAQSPFLLIQFEQEEAWAGQAGFSALLPYFDRDLVEFSLRIPPEYLFSEGRQKSPLRRMVVEKLPSVPLPQKKIGFTQAYQKILKEQGPSIWRELGGLERLAELKLVAPERLAPLLEAYFTQSTQRVSTEEINLTWLILSAETWLRAHRK